ncbi:MAG: hypothetical protein M1433_01590 [Candidatus Parvarchaeota archaeon]|nr:hypothetical protein [Candidatus Parvarchaeota archaeon]
MRAGNNIAQDKVVGSIAVVLVMFLLVSLVYYIYTAGPLGGVSSVSVINFSQSSSVVSVTNITPSFNSYNGQLVLAISLKNNADSAVGYVAGCVSPLTGNVYPVDTAYIINVSNEASCSALLEYILLPNSTATVVWPYSPSIIKVNTKGMFYAYLALRFGYYNVPYSCYANHDCRGTIISASNGTYVSEYINVNLLAR